jgi:hypothetical protein
MAHYYKHYSPSRYFHALVICEGRPINGFQIWYIQEYKGVGFSIHIWGYAIICYINPKGFNEADE